MSINRISSEAAMTDWILRVGVRRTATGRLWMAAVGLSLAALSTAARPSGQSAAAPVATRFAERPLTLAAADCTSAKLGDSIPATAIGEPVSSVTLSAPAWVEASGSAPARCEVEGRIAPVDSSSTARPINFRVWLPAAWNRRAVQQGGGGMNGIIPDLNGAQYAIDGRSPAQWGFVTYGSDSGHQAAFRPGRGGPGGAGFARGGMRRGGAPDAVTGGRGRAPAPVPAAADANEWALNDEAIRNLGYMQLKKTHDAAMVLIERAYGSRPLFNYFTGTSQGGREALTVAQRYPADYDGVIANVPIVGFSSLMLAPELIRIHEKPLSNWVTPAKTSAIRAEFVRQCDALDGLADGVIGNYMACRAIFDVKQGAKGRHPWAAKRCPDNVDPDPADSTPAACLTDGQISTLEFVYSRYPFATPLANGRKTFGMWLPNTDPSGSGLIAPQRFRGQEGAGPEAPMHSHLGALGVTGFLMRDIAANPLDYEEGGRWNGRREALSADLDSTDPDLRRFAQRGGKMIVTIGTDDTLASPGEQLDYYQAVLETMGRRSLDEFARLFVVPQANHGLMARTADVDGNGRAIARTTLPTSYERFALLVDWVEKHAAPAKSVTVSGGERTLPLCSYPQYPRYTGGPASAAGSYRCTEP
jgi:feruloyl esterase